MKDKILALYRFLSRVLIIFSVSVLILCFIARLFGEGARAISSMFRLGSQGIAMDTLMQLLLCAFLMQLIQEFFLSGKRFKNVMLVWRIAGMVIAIVLVIIGFVILFGWYPLDNGLAWLGFFLSFLICFTGSIILMAVKTRLEEKKYENLLDNYKNKKKKEGNE